MNTDHHPTRITVEMHGVKHIAERDNSDLSSKEFAELLFSLFITGAFGYDTEKLIDEVITYFKQNQ